MDLLEKTYEYIGEMMNYVFENNVDISDYKNDMYQAAKNAEMTEDYLLEAILMHWQNLVEKALADNFLSDEEENVLASITKAFPFSQSSLNNDDRLTRLAKAATLRDLMNGNPESRVNLGGAIPFKLQKNETLLWVFTNVEYEQFVNNRSVVGGNTGLSIKVAKGVYWRVGGFKAKPVVKTELKSIDLGDVFLTNKHIMFDGKLSNFKIRLSSLALIEPYGDGLQLQKGTQTALPFFLHPLDGWFCYNAIQNS